MPEIIPEPIEPKKIIKKAITYTMPELKPRNQTENKQFYSIVALAIIVILSLGGVMWRLNRLEKKYLAITPTTIDAAFRNQEALNYILQKVSDGVASGAIKFGQPPVPPTPFTAGVPTETPPAPTPAPTPEPTPPTNP